MARILLNVPKTASRGEVIEIKTLIAHPMESGYRTGTNGRLIPQDIITLFVCRFEGEEIFRAELSPAIAANPFLSFFAKVGRSGKFTFEWRGDDGFVAEDSAEIQVA
jgi:sulfur-oxidizing protein SoxZ